MVSRFIALYCLLYATRLVNGFTIRSAQVDKSLLNHIMMVDQNKEIAAEAPMEQLQSGDDPCWQNMLDDDCSMGNIYAANFVAAKWIQSMPCGEGIEDCDMPAALSSPDARPEAGVDQMDVMNFLGLKRADSLNTKLP